MSFNETQVKALAAKLDASHVKGRSQGGRTVSYIEGWHAIAEANRIFGFDAWDRETIELRQLGQPYKNHKDNCVVNYACKVRITVRTADKVIVREGCGFGSGIDKDEGQAHESAIKEAETDAMKRGLMTFGNPFGLALYDKAQENVEKESPRQQPKQIGTNQMSAGELAAMNAINACETYAALTALLNREKDTFGSLPDGGADRVRALAGQRLKALKPKEAA